MAPLGEAARAPPTLRLLMGGAEAAPDIRARNDLTRARRDHR